MKKLIAGFMTALMALLTITSPVLAASDPCPIALDIITVPPQAAQGLLVVLKLDGVPLEQSYVNDYYEVMFEVSDVISGSCVGKVFEAVIVSCESNPACHKNVMFSSAGWQTWDITAVPIPTTTTVPLPTTTTTIAPTTTTTLCEDCVDCDDCVDSVDCLDCDYTEPIAIAIVIAFLFTATGSVWYVKKYFLSFVKNGWGVRLYKSQDGTKIQVFHKHPGIRGYHNTETQHNNLEIRHKAGIIFG